MKRLLALVTAKLGWWWIWTRDHDGAVRLRVVRTSPFEENIVRGICQRTGVLEKDGSIRGGSYLKRWKHYAGRQRWPA